MRLRNIFSRNKKDKKIEFFNNKNKKTKPYKLNCNRKRTNDKFLVYDKNTKKIMKKITGIGKKGSKDYVPGAMEIVFKDFKKAFKKNVLKKEEDTFSYNKFKYIDPKNRFKIESQKTKEESNNTLKAYKLTIFNNKSKDNTFYIKTVFGNQKYRQATQEMILQKYLEKKGINIIKPKLAYKGSIEYKSSFVPTQFIVYDYTSLKNVDFAYENNLISLGLFEHIERKCDNLKTDYLNNTGYRIFDLNPSNLFFKKTKDEYKLFVSDTFIQPISFFRKGYVEDAEKKGLIEK